MAKAFVSATNGEDLSGTGQTSVATSATMNVSAGNVLVAAVKHGSSVSGITDGVSNTFTQAGTATNTSSGWKLDIWYKLSATANATATFTASIGSTSFPGIVVMQFSGFTTAALDVFDNGGNADSSFTVITGSFTPVQTDEVIVGLALNSGNAATWGPTDTGYSTDANAVSGTGHQIYGQYKTTAVASSQTITATNDQGGFKASAAISFQETGGGGGGTVGQLLLLGAG